MDTKTLIRMANQIAGFFKSYPEEEAVNEVANHLKSFWDPRMLTSLIDIVERGRDRTQLDPVVIASAHRLSGGKSPLYNQNGEVGADSFEPTSPDPSY